MSGFEYVCNSINRNSHPSYSMYQSYVHMYIQTSSSTGDRESDLHARFSKYVLVSGLALRSLL